MPKIRISVVEAFPDAVRGVDLLLDAGATVADALSAPGVRERFPDAGSRLAGIFARRCDAATRLHDGDRIELYRPLIADAKKNRMERARQARAAREPHKRG